MSHYCYLTTNDRECILKYLSEGKSKRSIGKLLGRSPSTISREIQRHATPSGYWPSVAEQQYRQSRQKCRRRKILSLPASRTLVREKIGEEQWSPEQIACWLKENHASLQLSANTIYRAIYCGMMETEKLSHKAKGFKSFLRHKGKPRHKASDVETRGKIPISHSIDERPEAANNRSEFGHFEADTVLGKRGGSCVLTLVDRCTRFLIAVKLPKHNAKCVRNALLRIIASLPAGMIKTITPDRGKEFALHAEVTALTGVEFYFPPPHAPWARGTNENTNGLLREYLPKHQSMDHVTDAMLAAYVRKLNSRPHKTLHWRFPCDLVPSQVLHLG